MQYIETILQYIDPKLDYHGQVLCNRMMIGIFAIGFGISFLFGIFINNLKYTLYGGIVTTIINGILTIPSWPYFRKNPLKYKKIIKIKQD